MSAGRERTRGEAVTYVETISEYQAKGEVARIYAGIRDHMGALPAVFRLMSVDERILSAAWRAYPYAMENGSLGRAERELLALAVSRTNSCRYGMDGATHKLLDMGMPSTQIEAMFRADPGVEPRHLALISLAENVTRDPMADHARSTAAVRDTGLDSQEMREAATVVVWFNLLNRLVDGLGLPHEKAARRGALQSLRGAAYGISARLRRADTLPSLAAVSEGGAGETAVVILRQLLETLGPLEGRLPDEFTEGIRFQPRRISRTLVDEIRESGWTDAAIFRAAFVLAGREALLCWNAIVKHLKDPLSDELPGV
jgi:uncharacterized peroxidase-related enzyme